MIVALDNSIFTLMIYPGAEPRPNWQTGEPISHCSQRIDALIDHLSSIRATVLIPTPTLAEAMSTADGLEPVIDFISTHEVFSPASFDLKAAYELAEITKKAINAGRKRGDSDQPYQRIKLDRQIVAIAKANNANRLYTDDKSQSGFALEAGLEVAHTWDLPLPAKYAQHDLEFGEGRTPSG